MIVYKYNFPLTYTLKEDTKMFYTAQEDRKYIVEKNIDNSFNINVRNTDNKPVNMYNGVLYAIIQDANTMLLKKPLSVIDATLGKYKLNLTKEELALISVGFYQIAITMVDGQTETALFTNYMNEALLDLEIKETIMPRTYEATEIISFMAVEKMNINGITTNYMYSSYKLPSSVVSKTFAVYTTNWKGKVYVEGSILPLPENAPTSRDWFSIQINGNDYLDIQATPVTANVGKTGISNFNVDTVSTWLRVYYEADWDNVGTVNKILYKY